jgi:hypothetical protein
MTTRHEHAQTLIERLLSEESRKAVALDGWPAAMVQAGFRLHERTWNVDVIAQEILNEGVAQARLPCSVAHLWPALPGAGITPLLYSYLAGVPDVRFKASRRGLHFGQFVDSANLPGLHSGSFEDAEVVIVSGSDETIQAVQIQATGRVVGYGHKVSFSITDASSDVAAHARDVVMWRQQGCFSLRGIVFVGSAQESRDFCTSLATQIGHYEAVWNVDPTELDLQQRAQALGVAEFRAEIFRAGNGFVELGETPIDGVWRAPLAVQVKRVDSLDDVKAAVAIPHRHVQGVSTNLAIASLAHDLGATRICLPGELQAPEADWRHDGLPNIGVLVT